MARKNLWFRALVPALLLAVFVLVGAAEAATTPPTTPKNSAGAQTAKTVKKTSGIAKFVLGGLVKTVGNGTLSVTVTSASKNLSGLVKTDQTLPITSATKVTKNGKRVLLSSLTSKNKVRIFGTYNTKTAAFNKVRWVKVLK